MGGRITAGPPLTDTELGAVEGRLGELCGFRFGDVQRRSLGMAVARRMSALGAGSSADYVAQIAASKEVQGELGELLGEFTNTETHFFRHAGRFRLLREQVVEGVLAERSCSSDPIRVLSAGCSSGEEVYSSILTLLEPLARRPGRRLEVVGCDINHRALERARLGRYGRWSLRYTAPEVLARHFQPTPGMPASFDISSEVKRYATFRWANLLRTELGDAAPPDGFDVIFCCNVLIYMTDPAIAQILANLRGLLSQEGYLFLGYAESLQGARGEFEPVQAGDYVVYRRKRLRPSGAAARNAPREQVASAALTVAAVSTPSEARPLGARGRVEATRAVDPGAADADRACARARAELDADHQQAALAMLERLLQASPFHCGARLLKGYIRGSQGDWLEAVAECTKALDVEPYLAEAYLLLAMLLRQAGDLDSAMGEVKKALFLEPDLALGQYLLGRLHAQQGAQDSARKAYANAARTLRQRPELPVTAHVPFELGREALLHQIDRALGALSPRTSDDREAR